MDGLTIGEVAKEAQVNIETMRYYERRGLVPKPPRSISNYRLYPEDSVRRVHFIKRAQELGFFLKEIKDLLSLRATVGARCAQVQKRASDKFQDIEQKIKTLRAMKKALSKLISQCSGQGPVTNCPILESLDSEKKA